MAAYTTIDDPSAHFHTQLYTGNGSNPRNITNDGNSNLKPDFIWIKNRTDNSTDNITCNSSLGFDAPKGEGYPWENGPFGGQLATNSNGGISVPQATYGYVSAHLTDGFTVAAGGTNGDSCNANNKDYVAWQWKANGGTTTNLTGGNINSVVQANQTAGFSIVMYDGNDATGQSVNHGLGTTPQVVWVKRWNGTGDWFVYHETLGNTKHMHLNNQNAQATTSDFGNYGPNAQSFYTNNTGTCINGESYVAYCFADVQGFSKFGSYIANGQADGPFVYTGFKPGFVILRNATNSGYLWWILDSKRNPFNVTDTIMYTDYTDGDFDGSAHASNMGIDFLSNGFKITTNHTAVNNTGSINLYMAFAENPFVSSTGIPATAR
tara:strand:- start:406 stop:1539 length:1134 start_codon:yes stop_codon:yes gene_type:complete